MTEFPDGCGRYEAMKFLSHVVEKAAERGLKWRYKWNELKFNNKFGPGQVKKKLARDGRYVIFGAGRSTVQTHTTKLKSIRKAVGDKKKIKVWEKHDVNLPNHAMGALACDGTIKLYDNGCRGVKDFSMDMMAGRFFSISHCFVFDLIEEKE